jgi:hypothetical protein
LENMKALNEESKRASATAESSAKIVLEDTKRELENKQSNLNPTHLHQITALMEDQRALKHKVESIQQQYIHINTG